MKLIKKYSSKNFARKAFTMIEILIVVTIIGILAAVIIVGLNSSRTKAKIAAFKEEASGVAAGIAVDCDSNATPAVPTDTVNTNWAAAFTVTNCGATGNGTFLITATPVDGQVCTATVTDGGTTFVGADC